MAVRRIEPSHASHLSRAHVLRGIVSLAFVGPAGCDEPPAPSSAPDVPFDLAAAAPRPAIAPVGVELDPAAPGTPDVLQLFRSEEQLFALTSRPLAPVTENVGRYVYTLHVIDEASLTARAQTIPGCTELLGFAAKDGRRLALCANGTERTALLHDGVSWRRGAPLPGCTGDAPRPACVDRTTAAIACGHVAFVAERESAWRAFPFHRPPWGTCTSVALTSRSVLVGFSDGEWGGGMIRVDRRSGRQTTVDLGNSPPQVLELRRTARDTVSVLASGTLIYEVRDGADMSVRVLATNLDLAQANALLEGSGKGPFRLPPFSDGHLTLPDGEFDAMSADGATLYAQDHGMLDLLHPEAASMAWSVARHAPSQRSDDPFQVSDVDVAGPTRVYVATHDRGVVVFDRERKRAASVRFWQ